MDLKPTYFLCLGILLMASRVGAQVGAPTIVQFSFSNPGARSLGLGGAFVALADDATAAFANPAGLVQLSRAEVSLEGRLWAYSTPFTEGGRVSGHPTGNLLDNTPGLRTGVSSDSLAGLSFLSFVYPREDWKLAFFRHQSANFEAVTETQGLFSDTIHIEDDLLRLSSAREGATVRYPDIRTSTSLEMVTYGVSGAYRLAENFSIGAGLSYFDGVFANESGVFAAAEQNLPDGSFGPSSYVEETRVLSSEVTTVDASDWGFTGGFLWHVTGQWSAGGFYRQAPKFELNETQRTGPFLEPTISTNTVVVSASSPLRFPDVYGLGAAYRSRSGAVTLSFEWDRILYSDLNESLQQGDFDIEGLILDDGDELHIGFEYVFIESSPIIALRFGAWRDPDHQFRFEGDDEEDEVPLALLRAGEDQVHFAAGFGLVFRKFQIDVGIDLADLVDTASFSVIYSF